MNYKYTLSCLPGRMGKPDLHFLRMGAWLHPSGEIILAHGLMTHIEYNRIKEEGMIRLYDKPGQHWIGIYNTSGSFRWFRERKDGDEVGFLIPLTYNVYVGTINYKKMEVL